MSDETELEQLHVDTWGFCGCGHPDDNAEYVLGFLKILIDEMMEWCPPKGFSNNIVQFSSKEALLDWYDNRDFDGDDTKSYLKLKEEYCGGDKAMLFLSYWLDQKGYTEHGGSVYSAWITREGVELFMTYSKEGYTYTKNESQ